MRAEASRDELDQLIDMKAVDIMCEEIGLGAMHSLAEKLMMVMLVCRRNHPRGDIRRLDPNKTFENIMFYCINRIVNTINSKGEEGVHFADEMSKNLFGKL